MAKRTDMSALAAFHSLVRLHWHHDAGRRLGSVIGLAAVAFGATFHVAIAQEKPVADANSMRFAISAGITAIESSTDSRFALAAHVSASPHRRSGDGRFQLKVTSVPTAACDVSDLIFADGFESP